MPARTRKPPFRVQVIVETDLEYFRKALLGVRRFGFESELLTFADPWLPYQIASLEQFTEEDGIDGFVAAIRDADFESRLLGTNRPVVNISNTLRVPRTPVVTQDDQAVGRLAARHLRNCGCRSFGFIGQKKAGYSDQRWEGFSKTLSDQSLVKAIRFQSANLTATTYEKIKKWIATLPRPAGIFGVLDGFSLTAQRAAREMKLKIPEDIAILGAGDDDFQVDFEPISLSSVRLPAHKIGQAAGDLLAKILMNQSDGNEFVQLPVHEIARRRSTDIQYVDDPVVARAVQLIRENPGIRVAEVAQKLHRAQSGLQRSFRRTLGRSILSEIQRVRLSRAQALLLNTDEKLEVVAEQSGFASVQRLSVCFRERFGISPGAYRRES